jgi:hypothetical protein
MRLTLEAAAARLGVDPGVLLGVHQEHREEMAGAGPDAGPGGPTSTEEELAGLQASHEEHSGPLNPDTEIPPSRALAAPPLGG